MELQEALKFVQDNRFYGFNELVMAKGFKKNTVVLTLNASGGYAASAVGQVLAQLGHDKKARANIVKQFPNLREVGTGPDKRLIF